MTCVTKGALHINWWRIPNGSFVSSDKGAQCMIINFCPEAWYLQRFE
jgi:hypothetical protein